MNATEIVNTLKNIKGQNIKACWQRPVATPKDCPLTIVKTVCGYVRAGIDYANLAAVKDGIASGERSEVGPLPWGEWVQFPFIISHKGNEYVRLYPASFDNLKDEVTYTIDGAPATAEQVYRVAKKGEVKTHQVSLETFIECASPQMIAKAKSAIALNLSDRAISLNDVLANAYREICIDESLEKKECFALNAENLVSLG